MEGREGRHFIVGSAVKRPAGQIFSDAAPLFEEKVNVLPAALA